MAAVPDLRPAVYKPPTTQRAECDRHIRRLRAVQRAHQQTGRDDAAGYAGERIDALLEIHARLSALCV